jgi:VWFA-related protein
LSDTGTGISGLEKMWAVLRNEKKGISRAINYLAKSTVVFLLFDILFLQASYSDAQKNEDQEEIQHEVTVTLKLVQVYVTDKKGDPVVDLKKEDFVIYDNGKKQAITEFERHILRLPSAETEIQPEAIQETPLPKPRELKARKFFLFFDFAYNNARGILKAKKAALHFINTQLQPLDEVGVISYSATKSLKFHKNLTADHVEVRKIVESFGLKEIHGRAGNFGKEGVLHAANFSRKMIELAKSLRYSPGHKYIILFSSGIPYSMIYRRFISSEESASRLKYQNMCKELAASNSTIFTLDTEELKKMNMDIWQRGVFSLQTIASSTGGKYFGNINSYKKHLEKIQNLTACYYVLGYYIGENWDGEYHEVEVKAIRPGCEVHAQNGYFNPKPFSEYSGLEKKLHLADLALNEEPLFQTPVRFPLVALRCLIKGTPNVAFFSKVPMEKIEDISGKDVQISSIIFDGDDTIIKIESAKKDFTELPEGNIYYSSLLSTDPGEYKCCLVIRNLETGKGAVGSASVDVTERPVYGLQLDSILLLKPEEGAFYLEEPPGVYPFDTSQYSPLVEELDQRMGRIFSVVRCSYFDIRQPDIKLSADLFLQLAETKETIPVALSILNQHHEDDTIVFFIELQAEELQPGKYSLNLSAEDSLTQSKSQASTIFWVK